MIMIGIYDNDMDKVLINKSMNFTPTARLFVEPLLIYCFADAISSPQLLQL